MEILIFMMITLQIQIHCIENKLFQCVSMRTVFFPVCFDEIFQGTSLERDFYQVSGGDTRCHQLGPGPIRIDQKRSQINQNTFGTHLKSLFSRILKTHRPATKRQQNIDLDRKLENFLALEDSPVRSEGVRISLGVVGDHMVRSTLLPIRPWGPLMPNRGVLLAVWPGHL